MSKYLRHQPVITRNSDAPLGEDTWLSRMQQNLEKGAVQPRSVDQSLFNQINSIMNGKSKYPSVEAAVEDMKARSGLTAYLEKENENINKVSEEDAGEHKKVASDQNALKGMPIVVQKCPQIKNTLKNYIEGTKGNLPISAILEKLKSIHKNDVSDAKDWEDVNLLKLISQENLKAKQNNPSNYEIYSNLGKSDPAGMDDLDPSNTDAFHALNPAK